MQLLDSGEEKVKKICETIREQTLDPAKDEAKSIIEHAISEADKIVKRARVEAAELHEKAKQQCQQEKKVLASALNIACKQTLQALRQEIEISVFNSDLKSMISQALDEKVINRFLEVILEGLKKDGMDSDFEIFLTKNLSKEELSKNLAAQLLDKVNNKSIDLENRAKGFVLTIKDKDMSLEFSDEILAQILSNYVREDFRKLIFGATSSL